MTDITRLAENSIAVELAIAARNQEKAYQDDADITKKIGHLCGQAKSLAKLLEQARQAEPETFQPPGVEGVSRRMLGRLPFLPRRLSLVKKKKDGREGWSVAEISVLAEPRWWWRVASYLQVAGNHRRSAIVIGSKGIILLPSGALHEYFWPKPSKWIVIDKEYKPEKGSSHKFKVPSEYGKLFSEFSEKEISAQRLAASLEASMFTLAKAALRHQQVDGGAS